MMEDLRIKALYRLQEDVLGRLQAMADSQFEQAKLCGGTALARCWLDHRVSYDLDFSLPEGFDAAKMAAALKKAGIAHETKDIVDDPRKANQLHGYVSHLTGNFEPLQAVGRRATRSRAGAKRRAICSISMSCGRRSCPSSPSWIRSPMRFRQPL
jgi:hypothetical protein